MSESNTIDITVSRTIAYQGTSREAMSGISNFLKSKGSENQDVINIQGGCNQLAQIVDEARNMDISIDITRKNSQEYFLRAQLHYESRPSNITLSTEISVYLQQMQPPQPKMNTNERKANLHVVNTEK